MEACEPSTILLRLTRIFLMAAWKNASWRTSQCSASSLGSIRTITSFQSSCKDSSTIWGQVRSMSSCSKIMRDTSDQRETKTGMTRRKRRVVESRQIWWLPEGAKRGSPSASKCLKPPIMNTARVITSTSSSETSMKGWGNFSRSWPRRNGSRLTSPTWSPDSTTMGTTLDSLAMSTA